MPEELQHKYGYLPLTDEDKQKIFGGNLGKLLGIDTTKRRGGANAVHESLNDSAKPITIKTPKTTKKEETEMADNTYNIIVSSPMGEVDGTAVLNIDGVSIGGSLTFMGKVNTFTNGTIDADGNIAFGGDLATPMGKIPYTLTGTFKGGIIAAIAKTKMGDIPIKSK
jgi:hypothetical protein